jgi:hypothetical protein
MDDCCRELKDQLMVLSVGGGKDLVLNSTGGDRRRKSTEMEVNTEVLDPFDDFLEQLTRTYSPPACASEMLLVFWLNQHFHDLLFNSSPESLFQHCCCEKAVINYSVRLGIAEKQHLLKHQCRLIRW